MQGNCLSFVVLSLFVVLLLACCLLVVCFSFAVFLFVGCCLLMMLMPHVCVTNTIICMKKTILGFTFETEAKNLGCDLNNQTTGARELLIVYLLLFVVCCLLFVAVCCSLFLVCSLVSDVCCLLFVVCCLLGFVR